MAAFRFNPRLIKTHRSYLVPEAASACGVTSHTVYRWIKSGLQVCDDEGPILILGRNLQPFLIQMRGRRKQRCGPGQLFCMRCNSPRVPIGRSATYRAKGATTGMLHGKCGQCGTLMFQASSLRKLSETRLHLDISMTSASLDIVDGSEPVTNDDFPEGAI